MTNGQALDQSPKTVHYFHACRSPSAQNSGIQSSEYFFCFVLFFCYCDSMEPQAFRMCVYWHHDSAILACSLGLLETRTEALSQEGTLPLPISPHASKQMLTISSFINKTSHSTARTISQMPQSFGCSQRIRIPNHPPRCRTAEWEKAVLWTFPHFDGLIQPPPPQSFASKHTLLKDSGHRRICPPTALVTLSGKPDFTAQWLEPAAVPLLRVHVCPASDL